MYNSYGLRYAAVHVVHGVEVVGRYRLFTVGTSIVCLSRVAVGGEEVIDLIAPTPFILPTSVLPKTSPSVTADVVTHYVMSQVALLELTMIQLLKLLV